MWNIIQLTHQLIFEHSIKQVLVAMLNMIMHEVVQLLRTFRREVSTIKQGKIAFAFASGICYFSSTFDFQIW
ncbi:hypothetical protein ACVNPX_08500 [Staphylococcus aureus]